MFPYPSSKRCPPVVILLSLVAFQDVVGVPIDDSTGTTSFHNQLGSCSTGELFHSILVECNSSECSNVIGTDGNSRPLCSDQPPSDSGQIVHVQSTRSGLRLACGNFSNLNYIENGYERSLNINTTLYLKTTATDGLYSNKDVVGFGITLDTDSLFESIAKDSFEQDHEMILKDLFNPTYESGANINILRLIVLPKHIKEKTQYDLAQLLITLDEHLTGTQDSVKVILDFRELSPESIKYLHEAITILSKSINRFKLLKLWAISADYHEKDLISLSAAIHTELGSSCHLFLSADINEAPVLLDNLSRTSQALPEGLLLKAKQSTPYNLLDHLASTYPNVLILTLDSGRPSTEDYGDWHNGKVFATEMMNHLRYGSLGFIEDMTVNEVLNNPIKGRDTSVYSLRSSGHQVHFKGPIYYGLAHYSGFVRSASNSSTRVIQSLEVFTQPNMFAAHYQAFRRQNGDIIVQVLNDNEHQLPFRLALNDRIVFFVHMEPKSFNTLLLRDGP